MKLFINCVASYPDGTHLSEEDLEAIREDMEDCLRWTGCTYPGFDIEIGTRVEA